MKLPAVNPVLARESRVRMRGWKAPALITLYVGILGFIAWFILAITKATGQTFAPELGGYIFATLGVAQFGLLVFSAPGLTAGAIAGEREKQTLDLLLITRLSPWQVVSGKLWAAVAFTLLLMFASLPVYSLLFLMGGIALTNLLQTTVVYVVTIFLLGAVGLYFSSVFRRTQAAVIASYGLALGWMLVMLIASILVFEVFRRPPDFPPPPSWAVVLGYVNPAFGLASAMGGPVSEVTRLYQ
ncbi:MAG TPA: ABC transporter permease subunit, partial [Symbiobacteriaceae bacterium]|nr:ABC transporter permease subunit [Symbiobacteriaceae bacterium]